MDEDDQIQTAVDAVVLRFWKHGFRTSSMRDIEVATGMSISRLYSHFGSKEELLNTALQRYGQMIEEELIKPVENAGGGLAVVEEFFRKLKRWVSEDGRRGCMLINMMAENGGDTCNIGKHSEDVSKRVFSSFRSALVRAERAGEITAGSPDDRACLLMGLVLGLNIAARGGAGDSELVGMFNAVQSQLRLWRIN
ncbi:MAG: TetR/AcrR family transcriptional regulator [Xanthomonadaceae bacterium]|nr:TetR/AcrR family transcriptional regulator [Xanthomonadaceae bacterium]